MLAVSMKNITKKFGSFTALDDVSFEAKKGTIHALLGENGAGKSTLMNILYGLTRPTEGIIHINGEQTDVKNPNIAIEKGIGMVHQHFMLVENFTVIQNIILGVELTNSFGVITEEKVRKDIIALSEKYDLTIDPDAKIEDISVGMQQRVEILKALYRGVDILILDEPTAVLTPQEIDELIKTMHNLIADGKTVIVITHKLNEIKKSAQLCTIIRRGKYIDTIEVDKITEEELAAKMVGRTVNLHVEKSKANPKDVVFAIENLVVKDKRGIDKVKGLSLQVRKGEIVGLAGIEGNGQKELVEAITCLTKVESGKITINGVEIQNTSPAFVIENGLATVHDDRYRRSMLPNFSVAENTVIKKYRENPFSKTKVLNFAEITELTKTLLQDFDIQPPNCEHQPIKSLSGGNQQKLVLAREIWSNPELLVVVQPTRGLDVGALEYIHQCLIKQRDNGKAVLLISLELDEIMDVSDTIAIIYEGKITNQMEASEATENKIGYYMAGGGGALDE